MEIRKNKKLTDYKIASHQADNKVRFQLAAAFAVLGLRKVLHFIHLDNASRRLSLLEFDHREERLT